MLTHLNPICAYLNHSIGCLQFSAIRKDVEMKRDLEKRFREESQAEANRLEKEKKRQEAIRLEKDKVRLAQQHQQPAQSP